MDRLVLGVFTVSIGFNVISSDNLVHNAITTVADALATKARVVCLLTKSVNDNDRRTQAIKDTWGKRCNKLAFLRDQYNSMDSMTPIQWQKFRLHAAFERYEADVDWFVLSSGGYILVENLRFMLSEYDPRDDLYFTPAVRSEGLKFVISKNGLNRVVTTDLSYFPFCNFSSDGDISSSCLNSIGLKQMDSKDFLNRERILPQSPYHNEYKRSFCYSDVAVSFDDVDPHLIYVIDYLIYQLRPFGINFDTNIPKSQKELKKKLNHQRNEIDNDNIEKRKLMYKMVNYNRSTALDKVITVNRLAEVKGYLRNNDMTRALPKKKKRYFFF